MGFLIDMIDVSYGASFLVTLDHSGVGERYVLIDGGKPAAGEVVVKHLNNYTNKYLDVVIATHLDDDHIGGLQSVTENLNIGSFIINVPGNFSDWLALKRIYEAYGRKAFSKKYLIESLETTNNLIQILKRKGIHVEGAVQGEWWDFGDIKLRVLNPTPGRINAAWAEEVLKKSSTSIITESKSLLGATTAPETTEGNDVGIVIELEYKEQPYALFTADVGVEVLKEITFGKSYAFLQVSHHGSQTGLDEELACQLSPKTAYIPVGENSYGHPATEVLDTLKKVGAETYCTQRTKYCRKGCTYNGFGTLSFKVDKEWHAGYSSVEPKNCLNNL